MIPPITDPMGKRWPQPDANNILIDETHALVSEADLKKLLEYSSSMPTGVYPGKMWKRFELGAWYLGWYGESEKGPNFCSNNFREILVC